MLRKYITPVLLFIIASIGVIHQYIVSGTIFNFDDLHHETFIMAFIIAGLVLFIVKRKLY